MARTTEEAVKEILDTSLTEPQILAFVNDANLWVTEELVNAGAVLTAGRLEIIERYLAAALCRIRDLGLKQVTIGDVKERYQADDKVSDYLKAAASWDPTGTIRRAFLADEDRHGKIIAEVGEGYADEV